MFVFQVFRRVPGDRRQPVLQVQRRHQGDDRDSRRRRFKNDSNALTHRAVWKLENYSLDEILKVDRRSNENWVKRNLETDLNLAYGYKETC